MLSTEGDDGEWYDIIPGTQPHPDGDARVEAAKSLKDQERVEWRVPKRTSVML